MIVRHHLFCLVAILVGGISFFATLLAACAAHFVPQFYGEFLMNAQGEDVVAGIRTPKPVKELAQDMPEMYRQRLAERIDALTHGLGEIDAAKV